MPLQVLFGDDEHTAQDGPYSRVMKARKWIYLGSGMAFFVHAGLYDPAATSAILRAIRLPAWVLQQALAFGLGYLLLQYLLLVTQLLSIYDIVLRDRFTDRRQAELDDARQRVEAAVQGRDDVARQMEGDVRADIEELTASREELIEIRRQKEERARQRLEIADRNVEAARDAYFALSRTNPANRAVYRQTEVAVDFLRIGPPFVFGAVYFYLTAGAALSGTWVFPIIL